MYKENTYWIFECSNGGFVFNITYIRTGRKSSALATIPSEPCNISVDQLHK